jgi:regulator of replication initiation timing
MNIINYLWSRLMALLDQVAKLVGYTNQLKQENADLKTQLVEALANDAADAQAIADAKSLADQAQIEAQAAKDAVTPLQELADVDKVEDEQITELLDSVVYPE